MSPTLPAAPKQPTRTGWALLLTSVAFFMVITAASIGKRFGRRRVYVAGLALFSLASAACALAPSTTLLIAARAIQGLGAAIVTPLSLTILTTAFGPKRRGRVIGIWGSIASLAEAAGGRPVDSAHPPHLSRRPLPHHKEPR